MGLKVVTPTLNEVPLAIADVSINTHKLTSVVDPTNPQDAGTKNYIDTAIAAINPGGSGVITGCGVSWTGTGLVFTVSAGTYTINGISYSVVQSNVTLTAADSTNPRFDVIVVNTISAADKITGTPAANPSIPTVDPSTQLFLTAIYIPAGATVPGGITSTLLYDENVGGPTEWNTSSGGATWNLASTNNPNTGSKDIEATSVGSGAFFQLEKSSGTIDPSTQTNLVFYIRSKAAWPSNRSLTISILNAGTQVGNGITFQNGSYGFVSSNTTSYQQIVIPMSVFLAGSNVFNQIKFLVAGSGGSLGFYFDTSTLQAGTVSNAQIFTLPHTWTAFQSFAGGEGIPLSPSAGISIPSSYGMIVQSGFQIGANNVLTIGSGGLLKII